MREIMSRIVIAGAFVLLGFSEVYGGVARTFRATTATEGVYAFSASENWDPAGPLTAGDDLTIEATSAAVTLKNDLTDYAPGSLTFAGSQAITLDGNLLTITDGTIAHTGTGTVTCKLPVMLNGDTAGISVAEKNAAVIFSGKVSGNAALISFSGLGSAYLKAANDFTGDIDLAMSYLWVQNNAALGTTDGATTVRNWVDANGSHVAQLVLDGVTLDEAITVNVQAYNNGCQLYYRGTCVLNGMVTQVGGAVRVVYMDGAKVYYNGGFSGVNTHVDSGGGTKTDVYFGGDLDAWVRFSTTGTYHFQGKYRATANAMFSANATMRLERENACVWSETSTGGLVWGTTQAGTLDLCGHEQTLLHLNASNCNANAKICNSGAAAATLRILNNASTKTSSGFNGKVADDVSVRVEGSVGEVPFTGASTSSGTLTASNSAVIVLRGNGTWVGDVAIEDGSTIRTEKAGCFGEYTQVRINAGGKLTLNDGARETVGMLYLGGVLQDRGKTYGSTASDADVKSDVYFDKDSTGVLAVDGKQQKTWIGGTSGNLAEAANWSPAGGILTGDSIVVDTSAGDVTLNNATSGFTLNGLRITGGKNLKMTGEKIALAAGSMVWSDAGSSNVFACPIELVSGVVTFAAASNLLGGAAFDFSGVISGAGGFATGGEHAGIYHFRAQNTYEGYTYLTNGLAYHLWSDDALGSSAQGTTYSVPSYLRGNGSDNTSDRLAAPLYFHGVHLDDDLVTGGNQSYALTFAAGTTNVLNGNITPAFNHDVERWHTKENALVTFNGAVTWNATVQLNAEGGRMVFNGPITANHIRSAPLPDSEVEFNGLITNASTFDIFSTGTTILGCKDIFGTVNQTVRFVSAGTLCLRGGHQRVKAFTLTGTVTSDDGTMLEVSPVGGAGGTDSLTFTGDVGVTLNSGTSQLKSGSSTTGALVATNGAVLTINGTWAGTQCTAETGSTIQLTASAVLPTKSVLTAVGSGATAGKFALAEGIDQTISKLVLNGEEAETGKAYGAGALATVQDTEHFSGTGIVRVESVAEGTARTWKGGTSGTWNVAANWEPQGVPTLNDSLTIAVTDGMTLENDIEDLSLTGLTLTGSGTVTITGKGLTLPNGSALRGTGAITVHVASRLTLGAGEVTINSSADANGGVTWYFDGGFAGFGHLRTAGDQTGKYHFTAESPNYSGNIYLVNGAAYDVYKNTSLGNTTGYTHYEVTVGTDTLNAGKTISPMTFHGVTIGENFLWSSVCSRSLYTSDHSTNVFNGTFGQCAAHTCNADRWYFGEASETTFNGDIGSDAVTGGCTFQILLIQGGKNGRVIINAAVKSTDVLRQDMGENGILEINHPIEAEKGVGLFGASTVLKVGCDNLLNGYQLMMSARNTTIDLNGHDLVVPALVKYSSNPALSETLGTLTITSANEALFRLQGSIDIPFTANLTGGAGLSVETGTAQTFAGTKAGTGVLKSLNGTTLTLGETTVWGGTGAYADATSRIIFAGNALTAACTLELAEGSVVELGEDVSMLVKNLVLGGTAVTTFTTYGSSTASGVDETSAYFTGSGTMMAIGTLSNVTRTWKGGNSGTWNVAANWEPEGVPMSGDHLVFNVTDANIATENDLERFAAGSLTVNGASAASEAAAHTCVISGTGFGILDGGTGIRTSGANLTLAARVTGYMVSGNVSVPLTAATNTTLNVTGPLAGSVPLEVNGEGVTHFRGVNAFTGNLKVTKGEFHAYGDAAFGTVDGKTTFAVPDDGSLKVYFHGMTTSEPIEWSQKAYAGSRGFFVASTTNIFNGCWTGLQGQPRLDIYAHAQAQFLGGIENDDGVMTVSTSQGAVLELGANVRLNQLRFAGYGELHLREPILQRPGGYPMAYSVGTQRIFFHADDVLQTYDIYSANFSRSTWIMQNAGSTVDVLGHEQTSITFWGVAGTIVTNGSDTATTWHVTQELHSATTGEGSYCHDTFAGSAGGALSLSFEGSGEPVSDAYYSPSSNPMVATQYLSGVSTATGTLTVKNHATVSLTDGGSWIAGNVEVRDNGLLLVNAGSKFSTTADVRLADEGVLDLAEGAVVACRHLYLDEKTDHEKRGIWGGPEAEGVTHRSTHLSGKGRLRVLGKIGTVVVVR